MKTPPKIGRLPLLPARRARGTSGKCPTLIPYKPVCSDQ